MLQKHAFLLEEDEFLKAYATNIPMDTLKRDSINFLFREKSRQIVTFSESYLMLV